MEKVSQDIKYIQILSKVKNWSANNFKHFFWTNASIHLLLSTAQLTYYYFPNLWNASLSLAFSSLSHTRAHLFALTLYPFLNYCIKIYILQKSLSDSFKLLLTAEYPDHFELFTFYIIISLSVSPPFQLVFEFLEDLAYLYSLMLCSHQTKNWNAE